MLKTLKDFNLIYTPDEEGDLEVKSIRVEKLKQEAIKDIKVIEGAVELETDLSFLHKPTQVESNAIKSYIMWKNDLENNFRLSDKEMIMKEYPYYGFSKKDVKEFIKRESDLLELYREKKISFHALLFRRNKLSGDLK